MSALTHNFTAQWRGAVAAAGIATLLLAGCGSTGSQPSTSPSNAKSQSSAVLPVDANPIKNSSTVEALTIDSVLVENNVDATGSDVDDHLEIAVSNNGKDELTQFEVHYSIEDPKTADSEGYYLKLPTSFVLAAGENRVIHFDNTGAADHFAVNQFSLYYTDTNALNVTVEVSAVDSAIQTKTVAKDAGGAEEAD
jgi:hypothetical protein